METRKPIATVLVMTTCVGLSNFDSDYSGLRTMYPVLALDSPLSRAQLLRTHLAPFWSAITFDRAISYDQGQEF